MYIAGILFFFCSSVIRFSVESKNYKISHCYTTRIDYDFDLIAIAKLTSCLQLHYSVCITVDY